VIYHGNYEDALSLSDFEHLCSMTGSRLLELNLPDSKHQALLCFICAGDLENIVKCWDQVTTHVSSRKSRLDQLQNLMEVVMLLKNLAYRRGKKCNLVKGNVRDTMLSKKTI